MACHADLTGASVQKHYGQVIAQEEAKDGFKELLASVDCASDWTWEQAMRLIISDRRCASASHLQHFCHVA